MKKIEYIVLIIICGLLLCSNIYEHVEYDQWKTARELLNGAFNYNENN